MTSKTKTSLTQKGVKPRLKLSPYRKAADILLEFQGIPHEELGIVFVNDLEIARIHGEFMDDPTPTDIMTFPLGETAELVISVETCSRQAKENKVSFERELCLYIAHGILHLAGYDDLTARDRVRMRRMEEKLMKQLESVGGIPA